MDDNAKLQYAAAIYSKDPQGVLGPWLLGALGDAFFIGLLWTQASTYYHSFPNDSKWTKGLVVIVWVLSSLKFCQTCYITWEKFVNGFGDWINIVLVGWDTYTIPVFSQALCFVAQLFFTWRCFTLTGRNKYLLFALLISIFTALVLSVFVSIRYAVAPFDNPQIQRYSTPQMSLNVLNDLVISVVVTIKLVQSRSGFNAATDSALKRLLAITWGAGIPPTICATLDMITFFAMPLKTVHVLFNFFTGRLYVFSMMYALNSRAAIREMLCQSPTLPSQEVSCTVPRFRTPGMTSSSGSDSALESRFQPLASIKVENEAMKPESKGEGEELPMAELSKSQSVAFKVSAFEPSGTLADPSEDTVADSKGRSQWV
ncbi:hypothetical protein FRC04_005506 [Tulasnella sp. 424]|nr:hypothetical protein FRC04_005506 [Tulasnella sp. 424]KAG8974992.1 hypothetical protein FRC05_006669 [Tulasnella sp. 425]